MNFDPLSDRVLIRRIEPLKATIGGILLPDVAQEKPTEGEVIAVGPGAYQNGVFVPMTVSVGDRVLFGKWSGTELDNGTKIVMREADIIGIVDRASSHSKAA